MGKYQILSRGDYQREHSKLTRYLKVLEKQLWSIGIVGSIIIAALAKTSADLDAFVIPLAIILYQYFQWNRKQHYKALEGALDKYLLTLPEDERHAVRIAELAG